MKKNLDIIKRFLNPTYLFHLTVLISVSYLFLFKYIPNMDAPQHLYNAEVLKQLIFSNSAFESYYMVNPVIVGYWTGHFVLTFFLLFLPGYLAEKAMLTVYIIGISYSFKYLVTSNERPLKFSAFLIFPFSYSFYTLSGYYSFAFAAVFFFLIIGFYLRNENNLSIKNIIILGLLFLGSFLSHAFVFALTGLTVFLFWSINSIFDFVNKENNSISINIKKGLSILASALPAIVLFAIYIIHIRNISSAITEQSESTNELIKQLFKIRPLIGFNFDVESTSTYAYLFLLIVFSGYIVWDNISNRGKLISKTNIWLIVTILFAGLYLLFPDRVTAGNLTHRISLYLFFNFLIWINLSKTPKWLGMIGFIIILIFFAKQRLYHAKVYTGLNKDIAEIEELKKEIEPNSTIIHFMESSNWLHGHFACYAAIDAPGVYLFNPQVKGKFPIVRNYDKMPYTFWGNYNLKISENDLPNDIAREIEIIDYVVVFDKQKYIETDRYKNNKPLMDRYYNLIKESKNKRAALYKFRYNDKLKMLQEEIKQNPEKFENKLTEKDKKLNLTKRGENILKLLRSL